MSSKHLTAALAALVVAAAAAGSFIVTTAAMDTLPDAVLAGGGCLVALLLVLAYFRSDGLSDARALRANTVVWALAGGALALWAAPLLALSQRASDAPSGTDSLFVTATACGVGVALASTLLPAEKGGVTLLSAAVAAAAGTAGLLASWETPSSFSPFAKFPAREALMLFSAVLFTVGIVALGHVVREAGARRAAVLGAAGAAGAGLLAAVPYLPSLFVGGVRPLVPCVYLGVCWAALAIGTAKCIENGGLAPVSAALLSAPLGVMLYAATERFTGAHGPDPVVWPGASAGIVVLLASAGAIVMAGTRGPMPAPGQWRAAALPLAAAGIACALGVAQLLTPALDAVAEGGVEAPFRAAWTMTGGEAAAGWLVFAATWLTLSAGLSAAQRGPLGAQASAIGLALVSLAASLPLARTTLHTWNRWVPADVQQTYGTEHSRLVTDVHGDPVRAGASLATLLAIAVLGAWMWRAQATSEGRSR